MPHAGGSQPCRATCISLYRQAQAAQCALQGHIHVPVEAVRVPMGGGRRKTPSSTCSRQSEVSPGSHCCLAQDTCTLGKTPAAGTYQLQQTHPNTTPQKDTSATDTPRRMHAGSTSCHLRVLTHQRTNACRALASCRAETSSDDAKNAVHLRPGHWVDSVSKAVSDCQ